MDVYYLDELGKGPTWFFYFKFLCDVFKRLTSSLTIPSIQGIKELDFKIADDITMGYSHISALSTWAQKTRNRSVLNTSV